MVAWSKLGAVCFYYSSEAVAYLDGPMDDGCLVKTGGGYETRTLNQTAKAV